MRFGQGFSFAYAILSVKHVFVHSREGDMELILPQDLKARRQILRYEIRESEQQETALEKKIESLKAKIYDLQRSRAEMREKLAQLEQEQPTGENEAAS